MDIEALEAITERRREQGVTDTRHRPDDWKASWEAHRRGQRTLGLMATPAQRLAWLEEMIELGYRTGALPRRHRADRARPSGQ